MIFSEVDNDLSFLCKYIETQQASQILSSAEQSNQMTLFSSNVQSPNAIFFKLIDIT